MTDAPSRPYPEHDAVRQHIAWLEQFIGGMTDANWKDMRLRAERQLEQLSGAVAQGSVGCGVDLATAKAIFERCAKMSEIFGVGRERASYGGSDIAVRIRADAVDFLAALLLSSTNSRTAED